MTNLTPQIMTRLVRLSFTLLVCLFAPGILSAAEIKLGFDDRYRPRHWTPVSVRISADDTLPVSIRMTRGLIYRNPGPTNRPLELVVPAGATLSPRVIGGGDAPTEPSAKAIDPGARLIVNATGAPLPGIEPPDVAVTLSPARLPTSLLAWDGATLAIDTPTLDEHRHIPRSFLADLSHLDLVDSDDPEKPFAPLGRAWKAIPRRIEADADLYRLFDAPPAEADRAITAALAAGGVLLTMLSATAAARSLTRSPLLIALSGPVCGGALAIVLVVFARLGPVDAVQDVAILEGGSGSPWFTEVHHTAIDRQGSRIASVRMAPDRWPMPRLLSSSADSSDTHRLIVTPVGMGGGLPGAGALDVAFDAPDNERLMMSTVSVVEIGGGCRLTLTDDGLTLANDTGLDLGGGLVFYRGRVAMVPELAPGGRVKLSRDGLEPFTDFVAAWREAGAGEAAARLARLSMLVFRGRLGTDAPVFVTSLPATKAFTSAASCRIIMWKGLFVVWGRRSPTPR